MHALLVFMHVALLLSCMHCYAGSLPQSRHVAPLQYYKIKKPLKSVFCDLHLSRRKHHKNGRQQER